VSQRTREIGVRMALGAQRTDILRHIIRRGLILTLAGVIAGLAIAFVVTQALTGMLYGIGPSDPVTFAAMAAVLLLVSVAASGLPAYRAARMNPNQALREP